MRRGNAGVCRPTGSRQCNFRAAGLVKTEEYWATKWRLNEEIKLAFDEAGVEIPFPQLDVHIKEH